MVRLIKKELLHILRDKGMVIFIIYAFSLDVMLAAKGFRLVPENVSIAVYDEDRSTASMQLIDLIRPPAFNFPKFIRDRRDIDRVMLESEVVIVLVIPSGFQKDLYRKMATLQVLIDGTQSSAAYLSLSYLQGIVAGFVKDFKGLSGVDSGIELKSRVLFNPSSRDDLYEGLNEFFMVITLIGMILPAMLLIREVEYGTIEQILISPLDVKRLIFAKVVAVMSFLTAVAGLSYLVVLKGWLGFPLKGSLWSFLLMILLYQFSTTGLSFTIASVARRFSQIGMLTIVVFAPMLLLSGGWVPPEALPPWLQQATRVSPLKQLMDTGVSMLIRGADFDLLLPGLLKMLIIGGVLLVAGTLMYVRRLKRL